jgi:hypothetical protein
MVATMVVGTRTSMASNTETITEVVIEVATREATREVAGAISSNPTTHVEAATMMVGSIREGATRGSVGIASGTTGVALVIGVAEAKGLCGAAEGTAWEANSHSIDSVVKMVASTIKWAGEDRTSSIL